MQNTTQIFTELSTKELFFKTSLFKYNKVGLLNVFFYVCVFECMSHLGGALRGLEL